jgi:hypothetical protein
MMALAVTVAGICGEHMALAALSTGQTVALVAGAWVLVIVAVVIHQIVHRRLQDRRFDRRLDSLRDAKQSGAAHSVGDSPAAPLEGDVSDERVRGITIDSANAAAEQAMRAMQDAQAQAQEQKQAASPAEIARQTFWEPEQPKPRPAPKVELHEPEEPAPDEMVPPPPPAPGAAAAPAAPPRPPTPTADSLHEPAPEAEEAVAEAVAEPVAESGERTETLAELAGFASGRSGYESDEADGDDFKEKDQDQREREQPEPLHFTAYHPREVAVETWQTLLVYAHTEAALPELRADVERYTPLLGERPRTAIGLATQPVERGTELTFVPRCEGVAFTPDRVTVRWEGGLSRAEFRFSVEAERAGMAGNGDVTIFAGPLIIGTLQLAMLFDMGEAALSNGADNTARVTASRFERIFASYSHADTKVVLACRDAYRALGLTVDIDVDSLRSGDPFAQVLRDLISEADVFQLFWSRHAAESTAVRTEWEWALGHDKGPGYIRPVYWEQPMPLPPPELADLHFAYLSLPE